MAKKKNEKAKQIEAFCKEAREKFKPDEEHTYCNLAVNFVCCKMGYMGFTNPKKLANEMVKIMKSSPDWAVVSPDDAKKLADDGRVVVAGLQADPHGHCAVVLPNRAMIFSRKWNKAVPTISNVGKTVEICGTNYGFGKEPKFYTWIEG